MTNEKIENVLVLGYFNARFGTYQKVEVNDNALVSYLTHDSNGYIISYYGKASHTHA